MGTVYAARWEGRDVALKVMSQMVVRDPVAVERFWREARILGQLQHRGIVELLAARKANGVLCLVLEKLDGATVREVLGRGPVPGHIALRWLRHVSEAPYRR